MRTYEEQLDGGFDSLLEEADAYFMETGKLRSTLDALSRQLDDAAIPYAVRGAIALARHGYPRMTVDIDLLLTPEGLAASRALRQRIAKMPPLAAMNDLLTDLKRHPTNAVLIKRLAASS